MSEPTAGDETLRNSEHTVEAARRTVDDVPIMPFGDDDPPETPDESGGAVAEHGEYPLPDAERPIDESGDDHAPADADRGVDVVDVDRG